MQATVSEKGQITLPKSLRERLNIGAGTRLGIDVLDEGTFTVRVLARGADGLFGLLARPGEQVRSVEQLDQAVTRAVVERSRGR